MNEAQIKKIESKLKKKRFRKKRKKYLKKLEKYEAILDNQIHIDSSVMRKIRKFPELQEKVKNFSYELFSAFYFKYTNKDFLVKIKSIVDSL